MEKPTKAKKSSTSALVVSVIGLILMYMVAMRTGSAFVLQGFGSPDTCWLLKLGQIICNSGIPKSDPFTFTLPLIAKSGTGPPFVIYQWLSEVIFYWVHVNFHVIGILVFGAALSALAFIVLPLRACMRANAPATWSFLVVVFASALDNLRCVLRPEIFTCLFLSAYLLLLQTQRLRVQAIDQADAPAGRSKIDFIFPIATTLVMTLWCNLHSGFVVGILLLLFYSIAFALADVRAKRPLSGATKTVLIAFASSLVTSLINPYGLSLWLYMPNLFFTPINNVIYELQPIGPELFTNVMYWPLIALTLLCYGALSVFLVSSARKNPTALRSPLTLASLLIILIVTVACFARRRMVSITSIIMLIETANVVGSVVHQSSWHQFWTKKWSFLLFDLLCCILVVQGVNDLQKHVIVSIPSPFQDFFPPYKALGLFQRIYNHGRIVADESVADMMELYLDPHNSLMADSRFDAYSVKVVWEWRVMLHAKLNWRELLDTYKIDWVVAIPINAVGVALEKDPAWQMLYKDRIASIFMRKVPFAANASNITQPLAPATVTH